MASSYTSFHYFMFVQLIYLLSIFHPSFQQQTYYNAKLSTSDFEALLDIKNSLTDLPSSSFFATWNSSAPDPCASFAGVGCSPSPGEGGGALRVTSLSLGSGQSGSLGLAGSLPDSLAELTGLTQLILAPGLVTGPIPARLGAPLAGLRVLSLAHNRLTGPVPATLAGLMGLHTLDLGFNRLSGPVPPGLLGGIPGLRVLILAGNGLTGPVPEPPPTTQQKQQLLHLDLKSNLLVGPIPSSLPLSLRYLSLSENQMWGPLNGLESLSELVYLDLSVNSFSGPLPPSLLHSTLSTLLLNRNNLSGEIAVPKLVLDDNKIIPYPRGSVLDLSHNAFSGEIPEALAGAESVYFNNNKFTGSVPEGYVAGLREGRTKTLYLQHNFLDAFPKNFDQGMLPDEVEICLAYNCMVPPVGLTTCPTSAGNQLSRPARQCSVFHNN